MIRVKQFLIGLITITLIGTYACKEDPPIEPEPPIGGGAYDLVIPKGFPTDVNIPDDNPMTNAGVKLGRYLYYDGRMSGKADEGMPMSCSSCHLQQFSFEFYRSDLFSFHTVCCDRLNILVILELIIWNLFRY